MAYNEKILKDDSIRIFLIGSGGPFNNEVRLASCIAVIAGGEFFLIDIGPGTSRIIDIMRLPIPHLSKILLTHFHSDHIGDLGEANMMSWANGRTKALEVYGPEGVEKVVNGFIMAYEHDTGYRVAHHGKDIMLPEAGTPISKTIEFSDPNERILCFGTNGLKVYAFQVDHSPAEPAVGYRIEYKGNAVVITGDTKKTDTLAEHCEGADILFSEAISYDLLNNMIEGLKRNNLTRPAKILKDIQDYHMDPVVAAKVAKEAGVKKLVYVHITPPLTNKATGELYLKGVSEIFDGVIILGRDRMKFKLKPKE
ncbi:MAG: MBL fold metallo-hydrolase [Candidatus Lokiarchaeota archaeon]|nr:MBL fold metallo-hydrolase [Candidatus Lokiarchaeota archaeon]